MAYNFQTFGNVVDDAFAELGVDANNTVAGLSQSQMESWGNRFSKIFIEKSGLKTQYDTYPFRTISDDSLGSAAISGATSLTTSTSKTTLGASSSGMILLDRIPYSYSAFSGTTMTTEAVDRAFSSGDTIQFGYAVPTNFGKPVSLYVDGGSDMIPRISAAQYELVKWGTFDVLTENQYSIFNDFIFLPKAITAADDVTLNYYKKATNTLTTTDTSEIYQMWDQYVSYMLVARGHRILHDEGMAQAYDQLAKETLAQARTQIAREDLSVNRAFVPNW